MGEQELQRQRNLGQFWSPDWIAEAMIGYAAPHTDLVFDPAVGKGAFYTALKKKFPEKIFYGTDIDRVIIDEAREEGIWDGDPRIEQRDFITKPPDQKFNSIVANPPYIRHHRLSDDQKVKTREIALEYLGHTLDGRAGLHIYFILQSLRLLEKDGKMAFIVPADTFEGVFAKTLWDNIAKKVCIEAIITFTQDASPFPDLDVNAVIILIKNTLPQKDLIWAKCSSRGKELFSFLSSDLKQKVDGIKVTRRTLSEALQTGFSRQPHIVLGRECKLGDFVSVVRGIATGANEFFFLTRQQAAGLNLPDEFFIPCIGRTRDINSTHIDQDTLDNLAKKGRPTRLLYLNDHLNNLPETVSSYLRTGVELGLPGRSLISTRNPWYKMEARKIPPFLFAYLGRRDVRFIRNEAGVVPLTCFLCVYPKDGVEHENLWQLLQHSEIIAGLSRVGKSYGSGAIKVEPRALERLPLPTDLITSLGLIQQSS